MDWKLEGSAQKTESRVLQEHEITLDDPGEDGVSESFQLLQIDVGCEHWEQETLPTGSAAWCSVSGTSCQVTGFEMMKCPRGRISRIDPGNEKIGNELGVFQGMSFMLPGLRFNFIWIIEKVN